MVHYRSILFYALVAICACPALSATLDGFSVGSVKYHGGEVAFVKDLTWKWTHASHVSEELILVGRDKWSAYLCGKGGFGFQLDLHDMVATYKSRTRRSVRYAIQSAGYAPINGRNLGNTNFIGGKLEQVEFKKWHLSTTSVTGFYHFVETARDEWSVYLSSQDGKAAVQIDYHLRLVRFRSVPGGPVFADFKITSADYSTKYHYRPDSFTCH